MRWRPELSGRQPTSICSSPFSFGAPPAQHFPWTWKEGEFVGVRIAGIDVQHTRRRQRLLIRDRVSVSIRDRYIGSEVVTCVIPGHDRCGEERRQRVLPTLLREETVAPTCHEKSSSPSPSSSSPPVFLCRAVRQPPWPSVSASSLPLVLHLPVLWGNKTRVVYASARLQRFGRRERNCSIRALFFGSRTALSTCATRRFPAGLCANLMARPIRDATRSSLGLAAAACPKFSLAGSSAHQSRTRTWRGRAAKRCA